MKIIEFFSFLSQLPGFTFDDSAARTSQQNETFTDGGTGGISNSGFENVRSIFGSWSNFRSGGLGGTGRAVNNQGIFSTRSDACVNPAGLIVSYLSSLQWTATGE